MNENPMGTGQPMTETTGREILAELRKLTDALVRVMPLLDNPATRFAARRKGAL